MSFSEMKNMMHASAVPLLANTKTSKDQRNRYLSMSADTVFNLRKR
jgi:hypothetical protein